jgi:hypothetical protein
MLSFLKRRTEPETTVALLPTLPAPQEADADARRNRQQNIKVSDDCAAAFAALAKAAGISKAALFEDLVAERLEKLQRAGQCMETTGV